jgi:hypothetical protein
MPRRHESGSVARAEGRADGVDDEGTETGLAEIAFAAGCFSTLAHSAV